MSLDREKLKKLAEEATSGEWSARGLSDHVRIERKNEVGTLNIAKCGSSKVTPRETNIADTWANANFIAAANPSAILALLSELEAAEARDEERKKVCLCFWCNQKFPFPRLGTHEEQARSLTDHAMSCLDNPIHKLATSEAALRTLREASARAGIYIASKTHHAEKWKALRAQGVPIISTWIDEAGIGETKSFPDLWRRCISEASSAELLIVYAEEGEQLKGALIEVGAALAGGVPVVMVGEIEPMKTAVNHSLVSKAESLEIALAAALAAEGSK